MASESEDGQFEDMSAQMLEEAQVLWDEQSISSTDDDEEDGIYQAQDFFVDFKKLKIHRELAEGGFGKIFKGEYLGTVVAIKKMLLSGTGDDEDIKYIEREVSTLKGIRHPNVVTFMGIAKHKGDFYIICEFVAKGDLTNLLGGDEEIPWIDRLKYAMDAAAAMVYLHDHGIIHRDLKAENLLLTDNGRVKICDLGFARTAKQLQRTMSIAGTGLYMAPEVVTGARYDAKCDVFGFGVVLFEICARRLPPKRTIKTRFGFTEDMLNPFLDGATPPVLKKIMMDCLSYKSEDRPSFTEALERLKELNRQLEAKDADEKREAEKAKEEKAKAREERAKAKVERRARRERRDSDKENRSSRRKSRDKTSADELDMEARIQKEVEARLAAEKDRLRAQVEAELKGSGPALPAGGAGKTGGGKAAERRVKRRSWAPNAFTTLWVKEELKKEDAKHAQDDTTVVAEKHEERKRQAKKKKKHGKKEKSRERKGSGELSRRKKDLEARASSPMPVRKNIDSPVKKHGSRKKNKLDEAKSTVAEEPRTKPPKDSDLQSSGGEDAAVKPKLRRKGSLLRKRESSEKLHGSILRKSDSVPPKPSRSKEKESKKKASKGSRKANKTEFVAL